MGKSFSLPNRFWAKVDKTDYCWNWTGGKLDGYGKVSWKNLTMRCSRLVMMSLGYDIEGKVIRHLCNNPACVNPDHLLPGSLIENAHDRHIAHISKLPKTA